MGLISFACEIGGAICGKIASIDGLVDGFTKGVFTTLDPKVVGNSLNNGGVFLTRVIPHFDPKVLASAIKQNQDFMENLNKELTK